MSKIAAEISSFSTGSTYRYSIDSYSSSGIGLGPLMCRITGSTSLNNFIGPSPISMIRPMEFSTAIPVTFPWAMRWSDNLDLVFAADNATAAVSRRILAATYDRTNSNFNILGFINLFYPTNVTAHTIRAFRMTYDAYSSGTVYVSGTQVRGSGTFFATDRFCTGNRIGFGTTVPSGVAAWYTVSGLIGETGMTLMSPVLTNYASGTPYVVEDLRAITVTTNATVGHGGVYLVKGLRLEDFNTAGTTIVPATGDCARGISWLRDNRNTNLNTVAFGAGLEDAVSSSEQNLWVLDTLANPILYKYNIRKPLSHTLSGIDYDTLQLKTAGGGVLVGTPTQTNNGRLANVQHGPGAGNTCLYFTTSTRIYRSSPVSSITSGSSAWLADAAVEIPPGGTNTTTASSLMSSIEHMGSIDKFCVTVNATNTPFRSYITEYNTTSSPFNRIWGCDTRTIDQSAADSSKTYIPNLQGAGYSVWAEGGIVYVCTNGTTAIANRIYTVPFGADWEYASSTNARIVLPVLSTPNCHKYSKCYVNAAKVLGRTTTTNLGSATEPFRIYYRTSGIEDNSGSWTLINDDGDLSGVTGAASIQFMLEFKTIGNQSIPARVLNIVVTYEDLSTDSHYQPSVAHSDLTNKRFAWRFSTAFNSPVPILQVRLYDAVTNTELVNDNTQSPVGVFQKSTDGGSNWTSYDTVDKSNETTYIRYTPFSLGDNIKVRALLTLNTT